ncbi:MAG TPA: tetratricopeptide repeat protein [Myxococcaceae bacterium]|nr:tetratricopeptide repeat protein [Myxococcaceae bacterium]
MTPEQTEQAAALLLKGDFEGALSAFGKALEEDPEDAVALLGSARAALAARDDARARSFLLRLLLVRPNHPEGLSQLAAIRFREDGAPEALEELRRLAARDEAQFPELYNLGVALIHAGEFEEAETALVSARQRSPDSPHVLAQLGQLAFQRGDTDRAIRDLSKAAELGPTEWHPLRLLARVHVARGEHREAKAALDLALRRFPDGPPLLLERAQVLLGLGEPAAALEDARALHRAHPDHPQAAHLHGVAALAAGQGPEAKEAFEHAIRLAPKAFEPRIALARLLGLAGHPGPQKHVLQEAHRLAPEAAAPALDLSNLLLTEGTEEALQQAADITAAALAHHPEDPGLHLNRALALRHRAPADALPHARKAAAADLPEIADQGRRLVALLEQASDA